MRKTFLCLAIVTMAAIACPMAAQTLSPPADSVADAGYAEKALLTGAAE